MKGIQRRGRGRRIFCLKVTKGQAESERKKLISEGLLNMDFSPRSDGEYVYFPLLRKIPGSMRLYFTQARKRTLTLEEALRKLGVPQSGMSKSYDIFGDIALVEIPKGMTRYAKRIAKAVMAVNPAVKVVAMKTGPISGEYRVRNLKVIGGENRTDTYHKETGCIFHVDIAKSYFSPRLSFERRRISGLVRLKERVFVPFAGVGPFPIIIAKQHPDVEVYANELNPYAFRSMEENIRINHVPNVKAYPGDVRDFAARFAGQADRIIMPIPMAADRFMDVAFVLARKGATAHIYMFEKSEDDA
ncbi:MAG: class I SAM-dependent methyltransferase family protein [Candidatus Micrarchaeia archaeon]